MSFQNINTVGNPQFYIDIGFKAGQQKVANMKKKPREKIIQVRLEEAARLNIVKKTITKQFKSITTSFPDLDGLSEFYQELVKCTIDYVSLKKSLASLKWVNGRIDDFFRIYNKKIRKSEDLKEIITIRNEFLGRVASVLKQIKKELDFLEQARKIFRKFPSIKDLPTIAIAGFPNVGKTTLLSKLTESKPEIAAYPFTTKTLNVGYSKFNNKKVQFIDTPGTLDRFEKMNSIEKQAFLAIKHCTDIIIYIFDLSEPYPLEKQEKLLKRLNKMNKPVVIYISKTDILEKDIVKDFSKKHKAITSIEELNKRLLRLLNMNAA